jgi:hypothetical protein
MFTLLIVVIRCTEADRTFTSRPSGKALEIIARLSTRLTMWRNCMMACRNRRRWFWWKVESVRRKTRWFGDLENLTKSPEFVRSEGKIC